MSHTCPWGAESSFWSLGFCVHGTGTVVPPAPRRRVDEVMDRGLVLLSFIFGFYLQKSSTFSHVTLGFERIRER